jgi:hypothetical protein
MRIGRRHAASLLAAAALSRGAAAQPVARNRVLVLGVAGDPANLER